MVSTNGYKLHSTLYKVLIDITTITYFLCRNLLNILGTLFFTSFCLNDRKNFLIISRYNAHKFLFACQKISVHTLFHIFARKKNSLAKGPSTYYVILNLKVLTPLPPRHISSYFADAPTPPIILRHIL